MIEELRKDEAMPLPDQISSIIRTRIETGEYRPGKRLGTIRQFAKDFAVNPRTVIKALDILEEESLIERIPVKGVFVSERLKPEKKQLNACFAFPEKEMAPQEIGNENWGLNYELYRGLFDGSRQYKINLQFIYFEDNPSRVLLEKQKAALRKFDFVIFPGDTQLIELRDASAAERLTFYLVSRLHIAHSSPAAIAVDFDTRGVIRELADFCLRTGCRTASIFADGVNLSTRPADFRDHLLECGWTAAQVKIWKIREKGDELRNKIKQFLQRKPEFIFVDYTEIMPAIFETAYDLDQIPGKDFIITGIASGMTFHGLFPRFPYFRVPRCEMGMQIMRAADEIIRRGRKIEKLEQLKAELINEDIISKKNQRKEYKNA